MPSKYETDITRANGGLHSVVPYKKTIDMLTNHTFRNARLYSLVFKGSQNKQDYKEPLNQLWAKLRDNDMPLEWASAWECDEDKGLHLHVLVLVESAKRIPCQFIRHRDGTWLTEMLKAYGLSFHISKPKNQVHWDGFKQPSYAYVPKTPGPRLDDVIAWSSYPYKVRSKAGVEGQIYSSSRKRATKPAASPKTGERKIPLTDSEQATTNNEQEEEMTPTNLIPSAFAYLGGLYETAVDRGYNPVEIQAYLGSKGIHKSVLAIKHDLSTVFEFAGYVEAHPAPPPLPQHVIDRTLR